MPLSLTDIWMPYLASCHGIVSAAHNRVMTSEDKNFQQFERDLLLVLQLGAGVKPATKASALSDAEVRAQAAENRAQAAEHLAHATASRPSFEDQIQQARQAQQAVAPRSEQGVQVIQKPAQQAAAKVMSYPLACSDYHMTALLLIIDCLSLLIMMIIESTVAFLCEYDCQSRWLATPCNMRHLSRMSCFASIYTFGTPETVSLASVWNEATDNSMHMCQSCPCITLVLCMTVASGLDDWKPDLACLLQSISCMVHALSQAAIGQASLCPVAPGPLC